MVMALKKIGDKCEALVIGDATFAHKIIELLEQDGYFCVVKSYARRVKSNIEFLSDISKVNLIDINTYIYEKIQNNHYNLFGFIGEHGKYYLFDFAKELVLFAFELDDVCLRTNVLPLVERDMIFDRMNVEFAPKLRELQNLAQLSATEMIFLLSDFAHEKWYGNVDAIFMNVVVTDVTQAMNATTKMIHTVTLKASKNILINRNKNVFDIVTKAGLLNDALKEIQETENLRHLFKYYFQNPDTPIENAIAYFYADIKRPNPRFTKIIKTIQKKGKRENARKS